METEEKIKLLEKKSKKLVQRLKKCDICPRNCNINRLENNTGYCQAGKDIIVYSAFLHRGEEPVISANAGSGTIFFSGCNLKCIYCQNYKFSHSQDGEVLSSADLSRVMLDLQSKDAENINLVTPSHYLPQILEALLIATKKGLDIPIVYNCSGYEKPEIIAELDGIIDIYLSDLKYLSTEPAKRYSKASNYPIFAQKSLLQMHRQVKPLMDQNTLKKGLIIRHLVLPGYIQESKAILLWIKKNTPKALVSVMFQYQPYFKAYTYPEINRSINQSEYNQIKEFVEELRLEGWVQDLNPREDLAGVHFKKDIKKTS